MKLKKEQILYSNIKSLVELAKKQVVYNVNTTMLLTNFQIGKFIIEDEQKNKIRANYASSTLKSSKLTKDFGKGFSVDNLEWFRKFYLLYRSRISATLSRKSEQLFSLTWSQKSMPYFYGYNPKYFNNFAIFMVITIKT